MRLLFLTQVLDREDAVLGFVPRWVEGLARECERVRVIALAAGKSLALPANVDVRVLGREGVVKRYLRNRRFLGEALHKDGFDTILAHMVPRYALLAAGPARRAGARLFLWYTHGGVDSRLRRSERCVEKIFTASEESLRLATPKKVVTGHGIDLDHFDARGIEPATPPRLIAVGRMTPAKDPVTLIEALALLLRRGLVLDLDLVGDVLAPGDQAYRAEVLQKIKTLGLEQRVHLHGSVPYRDIAPLYHRATALVSASRTGSVDKVVLEAMAAGRAVFTSNDACARLLRECDPKGGFQFPAGAAGELASRLEAYLALAPSERAALGRDLRQIVSRDHEVGRLMAHLVREMRTGP